MLLAVLEKRVGFKLAQKDVFLNIAGGLKVNDPAMDLSIISAILSSNIEQRISEAEKLGFKRILIPYNNLKGFDDKKLNIEIVPVRKVEEAFRQLFG